MDLFFLGYVLLSTILVFLVISIIAKRLFWILVIIIYEYRGWKAVVLSLTILFLSLFVLYVTVFNQDYFNTKQFLASFVLGVPFAFVLHKICIGLSNRGLTVYRTKTTRPRTKKSVIEWAIAGFFIGIPAYALVFMLVEAVFGIYIAILATLLTSIVFILFFAWWGSRRVFY